MAAGSWEPAQVVDPGAGGACDVALVRLAGGALLDEDWVVVPRVLRRGAWPVQTSAELCTDDPDTPRSVRVELVAGSRSEPLVQVNVIEDRQGLWSSHSGGPVVEHVAGLTPRVVGVLRARDTRSVDGGDRAAVGWMVPIERAAERFDEVRALTDTPVQREEAWAAHWQPRSRGVVSIGDEGDFFSGRKLACERLSEHLREGRGLLVVTAKRGHGKSALLARAVVQSTRRDRVAPGGADRQTGCGAVVAAVDAAVFARGLSAREVAAQIAVHLGYGDLSAVRLIERCAADVAAGRAPRVVVDGVDEASDPHAVLSEVLVKLADAGARVAIAVLQQRVGPLRARQLTWVDLDKAPYADDSIVVYVTRRLQADGYRAMEASKIADEVARRAQRNFLYAELVSRIVTGPGRARIDTSTVGWRGQLPTDVSEAFWEYLDRFGSDREQVLDLLHPLAHVRGQEGLTVNPGALWLACARALGPHGSGDADLARLRDVASRADDYLLVNAASGARRLYHEGLADTIKRRCAEQRLIATGASVSDDAIDREMRDAQRRFVDAMVAQLPQANAPADAYEACDRYLLVELPRQLGEIGRAAELLGRPGLLVSADPDALRSALVGGALRVPASLERARVAVVHALARPATTVSTRTAAMRAALRRQHDHELADAVAGALGHRLPYELISAPRLPNVLSTIPGAHSDWIGALAVLEHDGAPLVISAGDDGALRSWRLDGSEGPLRSDDAHSSPIRALAVLEHDGAPLVISAGDDGALRSWRLDGSEGPLRSDDAHSGPIRALAVLEHDGAPLVISAGADGALRSWRLDGSEGPLRSDDAHSSSIRALAVLEHDGAPLVISAGADGALRSWRLDGSEGPLRSDDAHSGPIRALAVLEHDGAPLVISAGADGALRSWRLDGSEGPLRSDDAHSRPIRALAVLEHDGAPLVISAGDDGALRSWRLDGSEGPLRSDDAHSRPIMALAVLEHDGAPLVISAGADGALRSWRLDGSEGPLRSDDAHSSPIRALAVLEHDGAPLVISAGADGALRSWRLDGSEGPLRSDDAHSRPIMALAVLEHDGAPLVISAGADGALRSWRLDGSEGPLRSDDAHSRPIMALAVLEHDGAPLVISAGADGALRSWRLDGSEGPLRSDDAHSGWIRALAVLEHDGAPLVISAGADGALRSWRLDGSEGPLRSDDAHSSPIWALAVLEHDGAPLVISAGDDGALRSWRLDGSEGPLRSDDAHSSPIMALAVLEHDGAPLVISAGADGALRSWRLDGSEGPLRSDDAHSDWIRALAVLEHDGAPLVISAGDDRAIVATQLAAEDHAPMS